MRLTIIVAVAIAFALGAQAASADSVQGALSEIGCWEDNFNSGTNCPSNQAQALRDPVGVLVSPGGKNVYMLSRQDAAIDEFARNTDGTLSPLQPSCIGATLDGGRCGTGVTGIERPSAIAISPDGDNVYVVASDSHGAGLIAEFARDPATGQLNQLSAPNDCVAENNGNGSDCVTQTAHGLNGPVALAVSPDGRNVYVADDVGNAVSEFSRGTGGALTQLSGPNDCIAEHGTTDCGNTSGHGLSSVDSIVVSPDGKNIYTGNLNLPGAIAEFARGSDGSLSQLGGNNACIQGIDGTDCGTNNAAVGIDGVRGLAVSRDGQNTYAASYQGHDIAEFTRNPDGSLAQLGGNNNCIQQTSAGTGCGAAGTGLNAVAELKVSPDGADVYATTWTDDCNSCLADVAELARNDDGSLTQLASPDNCIEETGSNGDCPTNNAGELGGGSSGVGLDISPDGKNVYSTGFDGVAELARNPVFRTLTVSRPGTGSGSVSDGAGGISCPSTCSHAYMAGSNITLTATPSSGSQFAGWSGAGCSGTGTCQITLTRDAAVTATFVPTGTPQITSSKPSVHGSNGAAFSGFVNPNNSPTNAFFQYGLDKRYTNPGSSGPQYTQSTPARFVGSNTSNDLVTASVANLIPNALYHVRLVATNGHGTSFGPDQTFTTLHGALPPPPTLGKSFNAAPVSGIVYLVLGNKLIPLTENTKIPAGAILDTLHGQLALTSASGGVTLASDARSKKAKKPKTFKGTFGGAVFQVTQTKAGPNKGQTTLTLVEGRAGAPSYKSCKAKRSADAAHTALSGRVLSRLRSRASGRYRTRGRYAAGTVRGTQWTTTDRCDGTLIAVQQHSVLVTDLVKHITILVRAGHHYLAKAPTQKKHK